MNKSKFWGRILVALLAIAMASVALFAQTTPFHAPSRPSNSELYAETGGTNPQIGQISNDPYENLPDNMAAALRNCPGNEAAVYEIMGRWELRYDKLKPCLTAMIKVTIVNDQVTYSRPYAGLQFTPGIPYRAAFNDITQSYRDFTVTGLAPGDKLFGAVQHSKWAGADGIWGEYYPMTSLQRNYEADYVHEVYLLVYADNDRATNHVTETPWAWASMVWAMYTCPLIF
ncbi:MAG TPA: hypothetical protein VM581_02065 [Magnetospirillaceae bacterium]|nr:hypothetical protein [Magnetospirillaceae bacterium]